MPKKKIEQLSQTHGKQEQFQPTTLEQIWGDTGLTRYKTMDETEYSTFLKDLNKSDLQAHAMSIGIIPIDNREMLTKRLVREFKSYVSGYRKPLDQRVTPSTISKEALSILSEGK
jgi:hypothetical protein